MQFKTNLSQKLICLIAGALLFETVFWLATNNLSEMKKHEAADASAAIAIVNKIDSISRRAVDIVTTCADPVQTPDPRINEENVEELKSEFESLSQLLKGDSEKLAVVKTSEDTAMQHVTAALMLRSQPTQQVSINQEHVIDPKWSKIQNHEIAVISDELKKLREEIGRRARSLKANQIEISNQINDIQIACLAFNAFALILIVHLLAKRITNRLNWITVVLILQLIGFATLLHSLQQQSDAEARQNIEALKTFNAIKEISTYFQDISTNISQNVLSQAKRYDRSPNRIANLVHELFPEAEDDLITKFMDNRHLVGFRYQMLIDSSSKDKDQLSTIQSSKTAADRVFTLLETMHRQLSKEVRDWQSRMLKDSPARQLAWRQVQNDIKDVSSINFVSIMNQELDKTSSSAKQQEWFRQRINLVLILECSIIFTGLSFIAVTVRGVTRRVNIMSDNAIRLASDLPLNRPEEGKDEISQLDRTFHTMAQSLKEATNKERAILQNASDVICSIEDAGHFTAVNPASLAVFGYAPDEMFGKLFVDFLFKDDRIMVVDAIDKLKKGADSEPIEARFVKKDGTVSDTLWSATWSPTEKTVFCVIHDITERKEAERMKQEVVAMITHDLRTPLSTIRNFHEMLSTGLLGELTEKAEKMLVLAERNSGRMLSLINDLLDVEKIKAGMMELSKEQISAGKVLEHTAQSLSALATESGVSLVCVVGSTPCVARSENAEVSTSHEAPNNEDVSKAEDLTFYADEDKISRVVTNLVSNAIKFSPPDTTIILSAESGDGNILISIKDQGRGIPQDKVANIFDRFQQVTAQDHAKAGGSGLGLAICKAIVELHGGEISVESTEGKGSTFKFSIPRELKS